MNMEKEKLEGLIIDYLDNKLNAVDRQTIEKELLTNPAAHKLYEELKEVLHVMDRAASMEPSGRLRSGFDAMLREQVQASGRGRTIFFHPNFYRAAAAVTLLIVGGYVGFWINRQHNQQIEMARIAQELAETKLLMMQMLGDDQSASKRIQGVNVALSMNKADDQLVKALVRTMNTDPNSNVRLAALEALGKFIHEPNVKAELIESLETQNDPVVQIALIQLMVKIREKSVINDLQRIVDDAETMQAVKDEAHTGILKLS